MPRRSLRIAGIPMILKGNFAFDRINYEGNRFLFSKHKKGAFAFFLEYIFDGLMFLKTYFRLVLL